MSLALQNALETLYGQERRRDKLGLEGTRMLLRALGHPERAFRSVHVAGTNGKGTVCALIERVLREAGVRTGLFTSPHLVDFRERIRVCGQWADEHRLAERLTYVQQLPEAKDRTFFEVCTALAFDDFSHRGVDCAVVEVGLGGRLDCTNVLAPAVTVITSVDLDHTDVLGDTVERIAAEKAGIVKPAVPLVLGPLDPAAAAIVRGIAAARGAPVRDDDPLKAWAGDAPVLPLAGPRLQRNLETALRALAVLRDAGYAINADAVTRGLRSVRWPGRLERCPARERLWWDGAHNTRALELLVTSWNALPADATGGAPPAAVVLALSRDKDANAMVNALRAWRPLPHLVVTRTRQLRAMPPEPLASAAAAAGFTHEIVPDVPAAVDAALDRASGGRVLLTGSLFAVGEAMKAFGGAPGELL